MNQAKNSTPVRDTNLVSVLRTIRCSQGVKQAALTQVEASDHQPDRNLELGPPNDSAGSHVDSATARAVVGQGQSSPEEVVSLRINPATHPAEDVSGDLLQSTIESAKQVQQLAERLSEFRTELRERESKLEGRIAEWKQAESKRSARLERQQSQVQQQAAQVRCQQINLMRLQTDIVNSHEAAKAAIESLVTETGSDAHTVETFRALRFELGEQFEFIARRWKHQAESMRQSQANSSEQQAGQNAVDWPGNLI